MSATGTPNPGSVVEGAKELGDQMNDYFPTIMPFSNISISMYGTPTGAEVAASKFGANVAGVIAIARGLELTEFNKVGGVVTLMLVVLAFLLITEGFFIFLPIATFLINWGYKLIVFIVQIVQAVLKLIPGT